MVSLLIFQAFVRGDDTLDNNERFVHLIHGSYSMFESVLHKDHYLGSKKNGTLELVNVHDKVFPDPRVLFLMHLKLSEKTPVP